MPASRRQDFAVLDDPLPHEVSKARYSLRSAIHDMAKNGRLTGLEAEVNAELARRMGASAPNMGFYLPWNAEVRDLTTTTGAGSITTRLGRLIDVLRSRLVCARLGATVLPDLRGGKFALPRKTATTALSWVGESASPAASNPVIDQQVVFDPKTTGAVTALSRTALHLIPNAEGLVIDDLLASVAVEIDRAALAGPGSANQPLGLVNNPAVPTVALGANGGTMTRAAVLAMELDVASANADVGSLAWVGSPAARAQMRTDQLGTGGGMFLWSDAGTILEYPALATSSMPANLTKGTGTNLSAILFGNWNDLVIGLWGPATIVVNPYKYSTTGNVEIIALQDLDVNVRHPESFVKCVDIVTT